VGHVRLVERLFGLVLEVLIPHVGSSIPGGSEVSVLCVECVEYTRTRARAGSGQQARTEHALLVLHASGPKPAVNSGVALGVGRVLQGLAQLARGRHGGALPIDRMTAGEGEPGLVQRNTSRLIARQSSITRSTS